MKRESFHVEPDAEAVKEIFADACDRPDDERRRVLDERCGLDGPLRREVENLLRAHEDAGRFMSDPPAAAQKAADSATHDASIEELPRYVGHFKLIRLLGQGGFGAVYEAQQEHPVRRTVALKIIKLGMDTRQVIARFEAERQALAMMDHPNIAKVFDAGATEAGRPYFVMDLVRGVPITDYCDARRLTIRQRLELFIPVCLAVGHAHQKGVVHRDIKPSNILVADQDGVAAPKVIDFGVAKATRSALADGTAYTGMRQLIGTLDYMSPEQADLNASAVDIRSDLYSLGALLYELLTGSAPFDATVLRSKGYSEAQRLIRDVTPARPSTRAITSTDVQGASARRAADPRRLAGMLRGDLDRVVMKCLEKDRERRYASAAALADDLRRYLAGEPVAAGPGNASYRARKFVQRHTAAVATAMGVAVALVVASVISTGLYVRERAALNRTVIAEKTAKDQRAAAEQAQGRAEANAAAATRAAQHASAVSRFLRDILALAEPESGAGGEEANVDDVLRRAAAEVDRLADRPEEQLLARRMLAEACSRIFLHDLAIEQLRLAHELSVALPGGGRSAQSLDIATELAMAMYVGRKGEEAAPLARATLADCRRELGMGHPVTWEAMHAAALCASETGNADETHALLKELVETVRHYPEGRRSDGLGRYLCNWSICLRDRGEFDAASAALREAAAIFRDDDARSPEHHLPTTAPANDFSAARLYLLGDRSPYMINASGWIVRAMVESGLPEVLPLIERNIANGLASYPRGTPTIAYRLEDVANLRLRVGDFEGAAAALARAIDMSHNLRGFDGEPEQSRWRMWTIRCNPDLTRGWHSAALRNQVFCALDDMLRDHPPARLAPQETPVERLRFKLIRWTSGLDVANDSIAEGNLDQFKRLADPEPGLYLLGLEVPRLGDDPLRKANWVLLVPWTVELRPIVRYDALRTDNSPNNRDWAGVLASHAYDRRQMLGLALHDGLALTTENPKRLQWFTAAATARVELPAGRYRFSASSDDGVRVFVDGRRVINDWTPRPSGTSDGQVELTGGVHDLKVDFFQETGGYSLWLQVMPLTKGARAAAVSLGGGVPGPDWNAVYHKFLMRQIPQEPIYALIYCDSLIRGGQFREAAAAYESLIQRGPADPLVWHRRAALLAYLGDASGFRQACREIFERFWGESDPAVMARVLATCCTFPELTADREQFRELLDRAAAVEASSAKTPYHKLVCGLARYRLGQWELAAELLRSSLVGMPQEQAVCRAAAETGFAMTLRRLGKSNEARAAFNRADRLIHDEVGTAGVDDLVSDGVENWLLCQTVWREARSLFDR